MMFWGLSWFFKQRGIDNKIARGQRISKQDAYLILKKAISIHDQLIRETWDDPTISGSDELHEQWIFWYKQILVLAYGGASLVTVDEALAQLDYDVFTHQYWIDYKEAHPDFRMGYRGSVKHHKKWKARWLAIIRLLEKA